MDIKYKKLWVDALRSGEYKQGRGRLFDGTCYCVMGVLGEVALGGYFPVGEEIYALNSSNAHMSCRLSDLREVGLGSTQQAVLISLNDDQGLTFNELADYIEENL